MPVIIGQLDVIAAPPPNVESPPDAPPKGLSVRDVERVLDVVEARRNRKAAD